MCYNVVYFIWPAAFLGLHIMSFFPFSFFFKRQFSLDFFFFNPGRVLIFILETLMG